METLNLTPSTAKRKTTRLVIYNIEGRTGSVQFLSTLFGGNIPPKLTLTGTFAAPRIPRASETPEQRKARLAALPRLTDAEKLTKLEEKVASMRKKLAATTSGVLKIAPTPATTAPTSAPTKAAAKKR